MITKASNSKYDQSLWNKTFSKTNLSVAVITIGILLAVLVFGNIIKLSG